ncbi:MAG: hypothetical protein K0S74_566 [Chlamydiales bacterium]|jgi:hypothetical protein|nr:hypothetical protein [Chlamydiales bacterium]
MNQYPVFEHRFLFYFTLGVAVFLHGSMLYLLQDMPITYTFSSKGYALSGNLLTEQESKLKQLQEQKRQEQVAQLLTQLKDGAKQATLQNTSNERVQPILRSDNDHKLTTILPSNELTIPNLEELALNNEALNFNFDNGALASTSLLPTTTLFDEPKIDFSIQSDLTQTLASKINPELDLEKGLLEVPTSSISTIAVLPQASAELRKFQLAEVAPSAQASSIGELANELNISGVPFANSTRNEGDSYWHGIGLHDETQLFPSEQITQQKESSILESLLEQQNLSQLPDNNKVHLPLVPSESETIAGSHDFNVKVEYLVRSDKKGYLFKIILEPKKDVSFKKIRQNLFFLLDRSHSINKNRYELSKEAIKQALTIALPQDRFNILVFDESVTALSTDPLECTPDNLEKAKIFLEGEAHGGVLASTELYASLDKIVPKEVAPDEVNTAILLSDGDTYLSREEQRLTIKRWTDKNQGKVSLYSIACGQRDNLALLDVLSSFNKGQLVYANQESLVSKGLSSLLQQIKTPVAKDIKVSAIASDHQTRLSLYPSNYQIPNLYFEKPLVIYGSINEPKDFYLFLQGKYYDKWVDIKQKITFKEAAQGQPFIEKEWTKQRAYEYYEHYLETGKTEYSRAAKHLLQSIKYPVAFE